MNEHHAINALLAEIDVEGEVSILSPAEAAQHRLSPLTTPIEVRSEGWMLKNFIRDMVRGGTIFALVAIGGLHAFEVWRRGLKFGQRSPYGSPSAARHGGIRATPHHHVTGAAPAGLE